MTPQQFVAKWRNVTLTERSASQQHFLDLCQLVGQPPPAEADPTDEEILERLLALNLERARGEEGMSQLVMEKSGTD